MHVPTNLDTKTPSKKSQPSQIASPPLDEPTPAQPTQIITIPIRENAALEKSNSTDGKIWKEALDILEKSEGFRALYWGVHVENELEEEGTGRVEVVVVRESMNNHQAFLSSPSYTNLLNTLAPLSPSTRSNSAPRIQIYHAHLSHFTRSPSTLTPPSNSNPDFVTGTAIYLTTQKSSFLKTWSLWTTIIPRIPGCLGCTGGFISESVDGHPAGSAYVVYVGWESIKAHEEYHTTKDFKRRGVILGLWNRGWRGYGHVRFLGGRGSLDWDEQRKRERGKL
ncbi:hypothetical protein BDV06DRAFT_236023 [Aspergillus oleicola]